MVGSASAGGVRLGAARPLPAADASDRRAPATEPVLGPPRRYDRPVAGIVDELERVRLFACLSPRQLKRLARTVKVREYRQGVDVVKEGTMSGVGFFIVSEGEGSISVEGAEVARIGPGDHFGELALISEGERTATVTAVTRLRCLVIAFWDFRRFAKENPDVSWALLQHLAELLTGERDRRSRAAALQV